jgi:single-strand DNA-binding protein
MSVNKVFLVGHLGADPEYHPNKDTSLPSNNACTLRMATNEQWKDKNGEKQERTEWHRIVAFGRKADLCAEFLKKGRQVLVEGKLRTRSYEDLNHKDVTRYVTEIVVERIDFLWARTPVEKSQEQATELQSEPAAQAEPEQDYPF